MIPAKRLLSTQAFLVTGTAIFFCGACSKPTPAPSPAAKTAAQTAAQAQAQADLRALVQHWRDQSKMPTSPLYAEVQKRGMDMALAPLPTHTAPVPMHDSPPPPPIAAPKRVLGSVLNSPADFTELIKQAGYQPHPDDPGYLPFFVGFTAKETADMNMPLPNGLKIYYAVQGDTLALVAEVRHLRPAELGSLQNSTAAFQQHPPDFVIKLNAGVPFFITAAFDVIRLPAGIEGDAAVLKQTLVVAIAVPNKDVTPKIVSGAVAKFLLALTPNQEIWQ